MSLLRVILFSPSLKQRSHTGCFFFDRQARPHLILSFKSLTGKALDLAVGTKPSFWNVTPELKATLLQAMLRVAFFHEQDGPDAREIVESEIPQLTADLSDLDSVDFDSDLSGTAGIDGHL